MSPAPDSGAAEPGPGLNTQIPRFQWNHRLHQEWGHSQLQFWRLAFSPTFNRKAVVTALTEVLRVHNVVSFALYEITGMHDLILRVWLPNATSLGEFERTLRSRLDSRHLQMYDIFIVSDIVMHWVWDNNGTEPMRAPTSNRIRTRMSDEKILSFNRAEISLEEFESAKRAHLVSESAPHRGAKFFVVIPHPHAVFTWAADELKERLSNVLRQAQSIQEKSLYEGTGFGQFLIIGRADYTNFTKIGEEILDPINDMGIGGFGVRTYTYVSPLSDFILFQELLPTDGARIHPTIAITDYLSQDESNTLEFKGSAFADLARWVHTDGERLQESSAVTNEGILKSIVAMLNGDGGFVIVGVLEVDKFKSQSAVAKLAAFPKFGRYVCTGIELEMQGHDFDWYQLRLRDIIKSRISPAAGSYVNIDKVEFEGVTLCVISAEGTDDEWFYLADDPKRPNALKFYAREGNRTNELVGPEADHYKRARPRRR